LFAVLVVALLAVSACSTVVPVREPKAGRPDITFTAPRVTVKIGNVGGRQALVDGGGRALYLFTRDRVDYSACPADCVDNWPALIGPARASAGVNPDRLGMFTRDDGAPQVTYFGSQLYYFAKDTRAGQANGQAIGRAWYLVDKDGNPIPS
jgi:predicted lipoprotein with Yx(FWY)xxD motif